MNRLPTSIHGLGTLLGTPLVAYSGDNDALDIRAYSHTSGVCLVCIFSTTLTTVQYFCHSLEVSSVFSCWRKEQLG